MAAQPYTGPVVAKDVAPPPAVDPKAESAAEGALEGAKVKGEEDEQEDGSMWETASLFEEILDEVEAFEYSTNGMDACTADEARQLKNRLHDVGASQFVMENITSEKMTARKLCTAFGVRLPKFLDNAPDESFYQLLGLAINRELNKRRRLDQYQTIDDAAKLLRERKNIMVITGAGISTSLGIPDFRSKNTGFYSRLLQMGYQEPEQVFDIHNFDDDPRTFYALAGDIIPDLEKWTPTHEFIRLLQDKDKLLTNYTQNIDNVEAHAGIRKDKLIQCHGSWANATCRKCKYKVPGEEIFDSVRAQKPAECKRCIEEIAAQKPGLKRKRSSHGGASRKKRSSGEDSESDGAFDIPQPGIMKPDITFFGEALPSNFFDRLKDEDRDKADLVIVMGTSMKVAPVSEIPNFLPRDVPQIYISRDPIHHINFDINLLGDCDVIVAELARRAGWDLEHKMIPEGQKTEIGTINEEDHTYSVKATGPVPENNNEIKAQINTESKNKNA
ncbi:SIR2-domain-containing protein [Dothidotthia symphoricarpi CBS 119687]|uniref:SIR2-domain-containing protein n=1 Tax=Dothidotthia symphoricarpi CBS 119687 TaxID=1392245 RepID=A0A6A6AM15_9PLEO|nr:SIR2-domain-containing protein [Dothidotthia symphoricarpi CBS 119687]KAF2131521.1 SIR2-domain-containing protein [Dothidotthia symphoricarpi CBS 119687]